MDFSFLGSSLTGQITENTGQGNCAEYGTFKSNPVSVFYAASVHKTVQKFRIVPYTLSPPFIKQVLCEIKWGLDIWTYEWLFYMISEK